MKLSLINKNIKNKRLSEAFQINNDEKITEEIPLEPIETEVEVPEVDETPVEPLQPNNIETSEPTTEVNPEPETNVDQLELQIKSIVDSFWDLRSQMLFVADTANVEELKQILTELSDDATISIGMLYKALELVSPQISLLINKGENKASETIINNK